MAGNLGKWPSKRGPISKIRPSDGCRRDAIPLTVVRRHDIHELGCHLRNVGYSNGELSEPDFEPSDGTALEALRNG